MKNSKNKKYSLCPLLLLFIVLGLAWPTGAVTFRSGDDITISNLHIIDDDFLAFGNQLIIDGIIEGDLVAGQISKTIIRGQIDNSADIVSWQIDHQGTITGSLRAVGNNVELSGNIGRSVLVLGRDFKLHPGAVIGRSLTANGDNLLIEGTVQGNVQLNGDRVVITGQIDGEVTIEAVEISIEPSATINGDITYISESEEKLTLAPGADVRGEIFYRTPTATEAQRNYTLRVLQIANILAAFILGIIVVRIFRPYAEESFRQLCSRFIASLASGLLGVIGLAFCLLLLALSILLLISGLVLMQGDISGMGMMFLVFSLYHSVSMFRPVNVSAVRPSRK